jgi:hypothetical protein
MQCSRQAGSPDMEHQDFDLLGASRAFTAVAMKGGSGMPDGAQRVAELAELIKEFCQTNVSEAFAGKDVMARAVGADVAPRGKFGTAKRMAAAIVKLMRANNICEPQDLINEGFTADEVERCWPMARALAQVELNMMDS